MIPFDFAYHKPQSIDMAVTLFHELRANGKDVFYYSGGTEFISRARMDEIKADAIIDLKGIPECREQKIEGNQVVIGSAVTLTELADSVSFPLLANVSRGIAHRTARNKITIGGNLSSHLWYREAILPFLLAESTVVIAGKDGLRKEPIFKNFQHGGQLENGEFIVQIITDSKFTGYPCTHYKKTKHSSVNYPIISLATLIKDGGIRVAFSGVCDFPFRSMDLEQELNDATNTFQKRVENSLKQLPGPIMDDMHASQDYRKMVLKSLLMETLEKAEGVF